MRRLLAVQLAAMAMMCPGCAFDLPVVRRRVLLKDVVSQASALLEKPARPPTVEEVLRDAGRIFR